MSGAFVDWAEGFIKLEKCLKFVLSLLQSYGVK